MNQVLFGNKSITPSKIVCIGRNYVEHIHELNNEIPDEPVLFIKPNSAISQHLSSKSDEPIHYEAELCFIVENSKLAGVGFGLDLTKRALQQQLKTKGLPWERAKAFDGSAVFSRFVPLDMAIDTLELELHINNQLVQQASPALMMYKPNQLLQFINEFMTLEDGDIIMTGTPKGVGQVHHKAQFLGQIVVNENNEVPVTLIEQNWTAA